MSNMNTSISIGSVKNTSIYHILGENVEVSGSFFYRDSNLISNIAKIIEEIIQLYLHLFHL